MAGRFDATFYRGKSWGARGIDDAWDLPTIKLRYLMQLVAARSGPNASLLEVGCGSGRILRSIRERDGDLQLTGIDIGEDQIALAARSNERDRIDFRNGDGQRMPFADAAFDYVAFFDFLEHIEDPQASLNEMARVITPGGTLHFVCPAEGELLTPYRLSHAIFGRHFKEATLGHIQMFTFAQLSLLVERAGFTITWRRYSYHLFGSLMDYALFTLMLHPRVAEIYWKHDRYHASESPPSPSIAGALLNALMTIGNAIAYCESIVLARLSVFASVVHVTATRT